MSSTFVTMNIVGLYPFCEACWRGYKRLHPFGRMATPFTSDAYTILKVSYSLILRKVFVHYINKWLRFY